MSLPLNLTFPSRTRRRRRRSLCLSWMAKRPRCT
ncbi:hypothetical protein chiPu_0026654, partial [Chiloscyllium punctatum]|nr:hypothetical protein [Chiloscyllium punctatum]